MTSDMLPRVFEDFAEGAIYEYGAHEVTREAIIEFAREFDPQPFHLDEEAGKRSLLGGLAASGWHTAGIAMRLHADNLFKGDAFLGSPGIAELNWMKPVFAGDVLSMRTEAKSVRLSQSRPGVGIVDFEFTMSNQHGERKMVNRGITMVATRELDRSRPVAASAPPTPTDGAPAPVGVSDPATLPDTNHLLSGYWDDAPLGETYDMGTYKFEAPDIIRFARNFDPQTFHLDAEAAKSGPFGALTASGWHTCAAAMRRLVLSRKPYFDEARRRNLPETAKGPSPGFRDLKWSKPVYAGDTLRFTMTPVNKRKTSREGWGILFSRVDGYNQRGEKPFEYTSASFWPLRTKD